MADGIGQQDNETVDSFDDPTSGRQLQRLSHLWAGQQGRSVFSRLEDAGNMSMNVDGSSTPVEFENGPSVTDEIWVIHGLRLLIADDAQLITGFWNVGVLTNGIDIEIYTGGSPTLKYALVDAANLKSTADMMTYLSDISMETPPSSEVLTAGTLLFPSPVRLTEAATDIMRVTVNDNLTGLAEMQATMLGTIETTRD